MGITTKIHITQDGEFDIALGKSRHDLSWKNTQMSWSDLLDRLKDTHHTPETYKEYISAKPERQMELKDCRGGFVGGYLAHGRRKASNLLHRQLLALDLDHVAPSLFGTLWDDFIMLYNSAACIYSTHKHSAATPRYRLIMPLSREVGPDEYEAIGRRIAGHIGIENFDNTGFEPSRLMYWPTTSIDGVYEFQYQDGAWIDADTVLATYKDWKDTSEWPIGEGYKNKIRSDIKKQGDPLEKPGVIGAFCRTYTIHESIEKFLADVYESCDVEDRYTYKEGTTSAGMITYEDKFAYSHHGTDPISMKLCNAFDLVRIHKFGLRDEDASKDTPVNKLPSYVAMQGFAVNDPEVRKRLGAEKLANAREEFEGEGYEFGADEELELPAAMDWIASLEVDRKGNYYATLDNCIIILENDPRLKGKIAFNTFEMRETVLGDLPWRKIEGTSDFLTDQDVSCLLHYLERLYKIPAAPKIEHALKVVYSRHKFHPVQDYLNAQKWDGVKRIETTLIEYLGCRDTAYVRVIAKKFFAAAVTRIFRPGCKFDYMLTLIGKQGLKKSSFFDRLGGAWFSDSFATVQGKEAWEQLQGAWIIEVAELSGMRKADVETVKHFISKRKDRYRVAYGRRVEEFARQCVFVGTTNDVTPLKDTTGGRRFWPVVLHWQAPTKDAGLDGDLTKTEVNQIWAEAMQLYKLGEKLYLTPEMELVAKEVQDSHSEHDERTGMVEKYLNTLLPANWAEMQIWDRRNWLKGADEIQAAGTKIRDRVCVMEVYCECLGGNQKDITAVITKDIHGMLRNMKNWTDGGQMSFAQYGRLKGYTRTNLKEMESELRKKEFIEFKENTEE